MRRRSPEGGPDAGEVAQVALEAAWWAERAAVDKLLSVEEYRRYAALTAQRPRSRPAGRRACRRSTLMLRWSIHDRIESTGMPMLVAPSDEDSITPPGLVREVLTSGLAGVGLQFRLGRPEQRRE